MQARLVECKKIGWQCREAALDVWRHSTLHKAISPRQNGFSVWTRFACTRLRKATSASFRCSACLWLVLWCSYRLDRPRRRGDRVKRSSSGCGTFRYGERPRARPSRRLKRNISPTYGVDRRAERRHGRLTALESGQGLPEQIQCFGGGSRGSCQP